MSVPAHRLRHREGIQSTTHLDEVLALGLRHQWLKLGGGESIDETSLRHDQQ